MLRSSLYLLTFDFSSYQIPRSPQGEDVALSGTGAACDFLRIGPTAHGQWGPTERRPGRYVTSRSHRRQSGEGAFRTIGATAEEVLGNPETSE